MSKDAWQLGAKICSVKAECQCPFLTFSRPNSRSALPPKAVDTEASPQSPYLARLGSPVARNRLSLCSQQATL